MPLARHVPALLSRVGRTEPWPLVTILLGTGPCGLCCWVDASPASCVRSIRFGPGSIPFGPASRVCLIQALQAVSVLFILTQAVQAVLSVWLRPCKPCCLRFSDVGLLRRLSTKDVGLLRRLSSKDVGLLRRLSTNVGN